MSDRATFVRQNIEEINYLAKVSQSIDVRRETKFGDVFHEATIEGFRFSAYFSYGGLALEGPNGVAMLGHGCVISSVPTETGTRRWWFGCADGGDTRNCMSVNGTMAVAHEFGAGVTPWKDEGYRSFDPAVRGVGTNWYRFYLSPAFRSLCAWATAHPKKIRSMDRGGNGLCDWQHAAQYGQYVWTD